MIGEVSALDKGNQKFVGPGRMIFEQYLKQSDVQGSKSIRRCPKESRVANS